MMRRNNLRLLVGLGIILWVAMINLGVSKLGTSLTIDLELIIVFTGLVLPLMAMTGLALQQGLERLQQNNVERAREEAFAEHHRFLRRLDHELKNPLTGILVGITNLRETCVEQQSILNGMEIQTRQLSRLVKDLRKLTEIETLPLEDVFFDLREMLEEMIVLLQDSTEYNDRQISLTLPPQSQGILPIIGDRDLLLVAIHNLIDNAVKFSQSEDRIDLRAYRDGSSIVIQVSDTGPGILSADIPLVWEELYRGQNTNGIPGSGIGLTLVQVIVKRLHGEVYLESQPLKGTTVTIRLPAAAIHGQSKFIL
jgi:two-component system, OmpR family, sensor kinase